jgi:hypothetical protein
MFITIEDETGIANLVIWPTLYEKQRRIVHSAGMMAVRGRIQREGEVVHLVAHRLTDLSGELASIAECDAPFPVPQGHGDGAKHGGGPDSREVPVRKACDVHIPDQQFDKIRVKTRDFRYAPKCAVQHKCNGFDPAVRVLRESVPGRPILGHNQKWVAESRISSGDEAAARCPATRPASNSGFAIRATSRDSDGVTASMAKR